MIDNILDGLREASYSLPLLKEEQVVGALNMVADSIVSEADELLAANAVDLSKMDKSNPLYDRLKLTRERLEGIASDMRKVAQLPCPVGELIDESVRPNGMKLRREIGRAHV